MTIHYGFVDIAIKQEIRDRLRQKKGMKSYSQFISELLDKEKINCNELSKQISKFPYKDEVGYFFADSD